MVTAIKHEITLWEQNFKSGHSKDKGTCLCVPLALSSYNKNEGWGGELWSINSLGGIWCVLYFYANLKP